MGSYKSVLKKTQEKSGPELIQPQRGWHKEYRGPRKSQKAAQLHRNWGYMDYDDIALVPTISGGST